MDFAGMSIGQLTQTYNEMVLTATDLDLPQFKVVKKFKDKPTGIKRCETIHAAIQEKKGGGSAGPGLKRLRNNSKSEELRKKVVEEQESAREAVRPAKKEETSKKAAKKPPNRVRLSVPDDGKIRILAETNPKRGTAGKRFAMYKNGMTVETYRNMVGKHAARDLNWDIKKGFIEVT